MREVRIGDLSEPLCTQEQQAAYDIGGSMLVDFGVDALYERLGFSFDGSRRYVPKSSEHHHTDGDH